MVVVRRGGVGVGWNPAGEDGGRGRAWGPMAATGLDFLGRTMRGSGVFNSHGCMSWLAREVAGVGDVGACVCGLCVRL